MANYQQVEKDIILSFKKLMKTKDFDDISIEDISEGAEITRRGFYNHFHDKYEVVSRIFELELVPEVLKVTNINDWYKGSILILNYLNQNSDYFRKLLPLRRQNSLQDEFHRLTEAQMKILISEVLGDKHLSEADRTFLTEYYYQAYMGLVEKWVEGSIPFTAEEFVMRWRSLLENSLHHYLNEFTD